MEGQTCHKTITEIKHQTNCHAITTSILANIKPRQQNAFFAFHDILDSGRFIAISFNKSTSTVKCILLSFTRYYKLVKQSIVTVFLISITIYFCQCIHNVNISLC